jgi:hypothetical protein
MCSDEFSVIQCRTLSQHTQYIVKCTHYTLILTARCFQSVCSSVTPWCVILFSTNSSPLVHSPVHFPLEPHQSRTVRPAGTFSWNADCTILAVELVQMFLPCMCFRSANLTFYLPKLWLLMKIRFFWYAAPCSLVGVDRRFRGVYCLKNQELIMFLFWAVTSCRLVDR